MDRAVIAVDDELTPYREALAAAGYRVVPLSGGTAMRDVAAIVVDSIDDRVMGIADPLGPAPVISVEGMTADEVVKSVRQRVEG